MEYGPFTGTRPPDYPRSRRLERNFFELATTIVNCKFRPRSTHPSSGEPPSRRISR